MRQKPVDQQVVALIGASSGIGRETAIRFAKRGAKVVVSGRNEGALRPLVDEIRCDDGEALAMPAYVAEFEQVEAVADMAAEEYGALDAWVHLSGDGLYATFDQTKPEDFRRVMDVNVVGRIYGAMVALPHQSGRVAGHPYISLRSNPSARHRSTVPLCLRRGQTRHPCLPGIPGCGVETPGVVRRCDQRHACGHKHALFQQLAHEAGREAHVVPTDLPTGHRGRRRPVRCRASHPRNRRRGCRQGDAPNSTPIG